MYAAFAVARLVSKIANNPAVTEGYRHRKCYITTCIIIIIVVAISKFIDFSFLERFTVLSYYRPVGALLRTNAVDLSFFGIGCLLILGATILIKKYIIEASERKVFFCLIAAFVFLLHVRISTELQAIDIEVGMKDRNTTFIFEDESLNSRPFNLIKFSSHYIFLYDRKTKGSVIVSRDILKRTDFHQ